MDNKKWIENFNTHSFWWMWQDPEFSKFTNAKRKRKKKKTRKECVKQQMKMKSNLNGTCTLNCISSFSNFLHQFRARISVKVRNWILWKKKIYFLFKNNIFISFTRVCSVHNHHLNIHASPGSWKLFFFGQFARKIWLVSDIVFHWKTILSFPVNFSTRCRLAD